MSVIDNAGLVVDRKREMRRVIFSSYLGSAVEFYDFLLYGTAAALVFPTVFFSGLDAVHLGDLLLRHVRRRLSGPPAGRGHLRPLRRPARPQEDAGADDVHHGRRVVPDRPGARLRRDRRRGARSSWSLLRIARASRSAASGAARR